MAAGTPSKLKLGWEAHGGVGCRWTEVPAEGSAAKSASADWAVPGGWRPGWRPPRQSPPRGRGGGGVWAFIFPRLLVLFPRPAGTCLIADEVPAVTSRACQ